MSLRAHLIYILVVCFFGLVCLLQFSAFEVYDEVLVQQSSQHPTLFHLSSIKSMKREQSILDDIYNIEDSSLKRRITKLVFGNYIQMMDEMTKLDEKDFFGLNSKRQHKALDTMIVMHHLGSHKTILKQLKQATWKEEVFGVNRTTYLTKLYIERLPSRGKEELRKLLQYYLSIKKSEPKKAQKVSSTLFKSMDIKLVHLYCLLWIDSQNEALNRHIWSMIRLTFPQYPSWFRKIFLQYILLAK